MRFLSAQSWPLHLVGLAAVLAFGCQPAPKSTEVSPSRSGPPFSGIVRDSITPVANVPVALYRGTSLLARTKSDETGRFSFGSQPAGDYKLSVESREYSACQTDVSFWPPQRDILIGVVPASDTARLRRQYEAGGRACTCRIPMLRPHSADRSATRAALQIPRGSNAIFAVDVVDTEDDIGVEGVVVTLSPDPKQSADERISAFTDKTGRATFANLTPGKYHVLARRIGFVPSNVDIVATAGRADSTALSLKWDVSQLCVIIRTGR